LHLSRVAVSRRQRRALWNAAGVGDRRAGAGDVARREDDPVGARIADIRLRIVRPGVAAGKDLVHGVVADARGRVAGNVAAEPERRLRRAVIRRVRMRTHVGGTVVVLVEGAAGAERLRAHAVDTGETGTTVGRHRARLGSVVPAPGALFALTVVAAGAAV